MKRSFYAGLEYSVKLMKLSGCTLYQQLSCLLHCRVLPDLLSDKLVSMATLAIMANCVFFPCLSVARFLNFIDNEFLSELNQNYNIYQSYHLTV